MLVYDLVLLTASKYLVDKTTDPLIDNIYEEDEILGESLQELGISYTRKAWDDLTFDWSSTKTVLIRTPWDYFDRYTEFKKWFQETKTKTNFINTHNLIDWNIDKHYLLDLQKAGVHIPKTLFVEPETKTTLLESIIKAKNEYDFSGSEFVLKPTIAGGAWHTYKFHEADSSTYEKQFQDLIAKEAMMLQEFQNKIVEDGEVSMMVMGGEFTHAVLKKAKSGDFRVQDDYGGTVQLYEPTLEEITFSENVVKACPEHPHYARVDIFEDNQGKLALAELEIFEPELWFRFNPNAAKLLTQHIKKCCID